MRTYNEMMQLIMDKAIEDDRIRAVLLNGSRANPNAVHDQYSDFDICYVVTDSREFTKDKDWVKYFGDILIVQYPDDWYSHPYDYNGKERFAYLIQFSDGNRIDLSLIDLTHMSEEAENVEPRIVLLNKDNFRELTPVREEDAFFIKKPSKMEYYNICNEFRWLSIYITKGLCRNELGYTKHAYDRTEMEMFMKMLDWKVGIQNNFRVTTGAHGKYLKRFLSETEMKRLHGIFPNGDYKDIWEKLFFMYDYFAENAKFVAKELGYIFDETETIRVRVFLEERYRQFCHI